MDPPALEEERKEEKSGFKKTKDFLSHEKIGVICLLFISPNSVLPLSHTVLHSFPV